MHYACLTKSLNTFQIPNTFVNTLFFSVCALFTNEYSFFINPVSSCTCIQQELCMSQNSVIMIIISKAGSATIQAVLEKLKSSMALCFLPNNSQLLFSLSHGYHSTEIGIFKFRMKQFFIILHSLQQEWRAEQGALLTIFHKELHLNFGTLMQ